MARVEWLKERCSRLRDSLPATGVVTDAEIAAVWPGGAENPKRNLEAWIRCSEQLHGFAGRIRNKLDDREVSVAERRRAVIEALADKPEGVPLFDGTRLTVYPKSYVALEAIQERSTQIAALIDGHKLLQEYKPETSADVDAMRELAPRIWSELGYLQRVIAWIATTEGPGLPFSESDTAPEPPEQFALLHPADLYAIAEAFQRVNVKRLLAIDSTRSNDTRPDWSVFIANLADGLNKPTPYVMRDVSLASAIAGAAERARGQEQALVAAERKAKEKQRSDGRRAA
jgi:hypothetical protein